MIIEARNLRAGDLLPGDYMAHRPHTACVCATFAAHFSDGLTGTVVVVRPRDARGLSSGSPEYMRVSSDYRVSLIDDLPRAASSKRDANIVSDEFLYMKECNDIVHGLRHGYLRTSAGMITVAFDELSPRIILSATGAGKKYTGILMRADNSTSQIRLTIDRMMKQMRARP